MRREKEKDAKKALTIDLFSMRVEWAVNWESRPPQTKMNGFTSIQSNWWLIHCMWYHCISSIENIIHSVCYQVNDVDWAHWLIVIKSWEMWLLCVINNNMFANLRLLLSLLFEMCMIDSVLNVVFQIVWREVIHSLRKWTLHISCVERSEISCPTIDHWNSLNL
jgi:hypothetical protein